MKEKVIELEIEREEQAKALEMVNALRHKERDLIESKLEKIKEDGNKQTDQVRGEMAVRIEK